MRILSYYFYFFFNDTATTEIYTLSLHDALPTSNSTPTFPPVFWPAPRFGWYRRGVRDGRRLREKIEVTVDDRQVAALAVGALLLLAGMFSLGLLVGMQLARRSPQAAF